MCLDCLAKSKVHEVISGPALGMHSDRIPLEINFNKNTSVAVKWRKDQGLESTRLDTGTADRYHLEYLTSAFQDGMFTVLRCCFIILDDLRNICTDSRALISTETTSVPVNSMD